jgi:hypothetical protein
MTPDYRAGLLRAAKIAREKADRVEKHVKDDFVVNALRTIADDIEREASQPETVPGPAPSPREKCGTCKGTKRAWSRGDCLRACLSCDGAPDCACVGCHRCPACNGTGTAGDKP